MKSEQQRGDDHHDRRDRRVAAEHAAPRDRARKATVSAASAIAAPTPNDGPSAPRGEAPCRTSTARRAPAASACRGRASRHAQSERRHGERDGRATGAAAARPRRRAPASSAERRLSVRPRHDARARRPRGPPRRIAVADRATPARRPPARARPRAVRRSAYFGSVETSLSHFVEQARALGRRAVLREVVVDELDLGELRRLRRRAAHSCSTAPGRTPSPARRSLCASGVSAQSYHFLAFSMFFAPLMMLMLPIS